MSEHIRPKQQCSKNKELKENDEEKNSRQFRFSYTSPAMRPNACMSDIYLTRRRPLIAYFKRASFLIKDSTCQIISIHGLGVCVTAAVWLVQDLLEQFTPLIEIQETKTHSIPVLDEGIEDNLEVFQLIQSWKSCLISRY